MKLILVSDTHRMHGQIRIPQGDVLIHAGDMTNLGELGELDSVASFFSKQPHKHKIVICGNHERQVSEDTETVKSIFEPYGIKVLHNETIEINGVKFYGEPRTPEFFNWGWMYKRGKEAEEIWNKVPEDTDVLICHGPPYGYGDLAPRLFGFCGVPSGFENKPHHVGCRQQLKMLQRIKPKLVVCGHIHFSYGIHLTDFGTVIANAAICTEGYKPKNKPLEINI